MSGCDYLLSAMFDQYGEGEWALRVSTSGVNYEGCSYPRRGLCGYMGTSLIKNTHPPRITMGP